MKKVDFGSSSSFPVPRSGESSPEIPASSGQLNTQMPPEQPADGRTKAQMARARALAFIQLQAPPVEVDSGEDSVSDVEETTGISPSQSSGSRIQISVKDIYDHWQPSQKNDNIKRSSVDFLKKQMQTDMASVEPITIQSFEKQEGMPPEIRTLDGRHRLTAAHELGLETIPVKNDENSREVAKHFGA